MKITIRNLQSKVSLNSKKAIKAAKAVLSSQGIRKSGEITLSFVNDKEIKRLNLSYLGKNNPTDVIAFDLTHPKQPDKIYADIVISTQRAVSNARVFKTSPLFEVYLYVIHGVLHILGYDDQNKKDALIMWKKQAELLKILHLSK